MNPSTEQRPAPDAPAKKRSSERLVGIFMVLGSLVLGYLSILLPLEAASRHEEDVSISMKGVVFVPALLGIGLFLMFTGDKPNQLLGTRHKPTVVGWIFCIGIAVLGIVLYEWLKSTLRSYGYGFDRDN